MTTVHQSAFGGNATALPIVRYRRPDPAPYPARIVAQRHHLPIRRARLVAELAGFQMEAAHA